MYEIKYRDEDLVKDSGFEWIGYIPDNWEIKKLRYLATIDTGSKDTQDKVENGAYPFYVRSDTVERIDSYSFNGEAILTAGDGVGVGKVFHYVEGKFAFHQRVYKLSDFKNIMGKYLYYYISENFHKEVMKVSAKSTVDSLRRPMFSNFPVALPERIEQYKIANFLDFKIAQFNEIIEKKEQLIEKLEEAKKSLISEVVTGKMKIANGELVDREVSEMKDSGIEWLGSVPREWEKKKFKRCFKVKNGKEISDENIKNKKVISVYGSGGVFKYTGRHLYNGESVLFGRKGTIGKPLFVNGKFWTVDTMYYTNFYDGFYPKFFYYQLLCFPWSTITTTTALPSVVGSDIENATTITPSLREMKQICDYIETKNIMFESSVRLIMDQIKRIKQAQQSLISEAVTGKIDLRDWEIIEGGGLQ